MPEWVMGNGVMGYFARGPPFFAWVVDETKEEANSRTSLQVNFLLS